MAKAIASEIKMQRSFLINDVHTIYFGGGTPSLLSEEPLSLLMNALEATFELKNTEEITLEANPDDIDEGKLWLWKKLGINRLSIGIQSFNDETLRWMNRAHSSQEAHEAIQLAANAGFDLNLDLIYAIPQHATWEEDIHQLIDYRPTHISAYALTIEEGTAFGSWLKKGRLKPLDEEIAAIQYEKLVEITSQNGYEHYEVSNFCLPNHQSRHNTSYWKGRTYLGIGPSAHSYDGTARHFNLANNQKYMRLIEEGELPRVTDSLTAKDKINELLLTGLRTKWGVSIPALKGLNYVLDDQKIRYLHELEKRGLAIVKNDNIILTERGWLLSDGITEKLMVL